MRPDLHALDGARFDVAIIGAGINGAAAALAAAKAGYRVALVDKGDYGSGSSARSSRLLHCGLRYLMPGGPWTVFLRRPDRLLDAIRTIRRSMAVRSELVRGGQVSLQPLRMHYPLYRDGPYKPWMLDVAFGILGAVSDGKVPLDYRRSNPAQARRSNPFVEFLGHPEKVASIASYTEYQFDWPERSVMDMVLQAQQLGAVARNYTEVQALQRDGGQWLLRLRDAADGVQATLGASAVLNLAGAWVDEVNGRASASPSRKVTGTKGAHLVFRLPQQCRGQGFAAMSTVNRPFYCMPWRDLHFFGPTETLYEGDLNDVRCDAADVEFLLREARHLFPGLGLSREQIVSTWAGIRPLTYDASLPMGHRSRRIYDLAEEGMPGVYALTNGSLGAHRKTGQDVVDAMAARLPAPGPMAFREPLPPGEFDAIAEHVVTLEDYLARRKGWLWDADQGLDRAPQAAAELAARLGWEADRTERELADYRAIVNRLYGLP